MFRGLVIENFKAFGERQEIPFAPITLIFGENSAGKSSILQALLLLKQSADEVHANTFLRPNGELVNLGSLRNATFGHGGNPIEISPVFDMVNVPTLFAGGLDVASPSRHVVLTGLGFGAHPIVGMGVRARVNAKNETSLASLPIYLGAITESAFDLTVDDTPKPWPPPSKIPSNPYTEFAVGRLDGRPDLPLVESVNPKTQTIDDSLHYVDKAHLNVRHPFWRSYFSNYPETLPFGRGDVYPFEAMIQDALASLANRRLLFDRFTLRFASGSHDSPYPEGDIVDSYLNAAIPDLANIAIETALDLQAILSRVRYIGPLRKVQDRFHVYSGVRRADVGLAGALTADILYSQDQVLANVNEWLRRFKTGYQIPELRRLDGDVPGAYSLLASDTTTGIELGLPDLGFGIGQMLPVIVQSMISNDDVILIEQPELHLHPRLQAELGSMFSEAINQDHRNQFIIETHSEHLILRLLRLIRNGQLNSSDVSVLYVGREQTKHQPGSWCRQLRVDTHGDFIDDWPNGFFEEGFREMFDL